MSDITKWIASVVTANLLMIIFGFGAFHNDPGKLTSWYAMIAFTTGAALRLGWVWLRRRRHGRGTKG
jgi:hypothetical protein